MLINHLKGIKSFLNKGGGFVGIHAAASGKIRKPWFDSLIGGVFVNHPQLQAAVLEVEDSNFPATWYLPKKWLWSDEWYNFKNINIEELNVILTVDENTYDYDLGHDGIPLKGMREKHPIAWSHFYEGRKVFYTALGHKPEAYRNHNFMQHILGGIYWVSKKRK